MAGSVTVFGGTGFIGRHLVALLLQSGATVRVAVRHPGRLKMAAEPAKAPEIVRADILDDTSVGSAIAGAHVVFNLVGILTETAGNLYATPRTYTPAEFPSRFTNGVATREPSMFYERPWMGGKWGIRDAIEYMLTADFAILNIAASRRARGRELS